MATYIRLAEITLDSQDAQIDFASIPNTYRDLVLTVNASHSTYAGLRLTVNSSTSGYGQVHAKSYSGSVAGEASSGTSGISFTPGTVGINANVEYSYVMNFMNYADSKPKAGLLRFGLNSAGVEMGAFLWNSNNPITSINIFLSAGSYQPGSTFALYGIEA